ncbi:MAG: (Na+)-NQR maturation NqrM [Gammaproteobacteria bacterium]|nr:(Na+)-NQR maturation NqrM [Gammaproteobacteria bacterium]NNJ85437.1 (Na+)-NQR maturation NqrM [Gammaproteobacteria bacterium]
MEIFITSFVIILIAVTGMAVGVIFGGEKKCIKGSCGGIASLPGMEGGCSACGKDAAPEDKENS